MKILLSISDFYENIPKILLDSAVLVLRKNNINYEYVIVPGISQLASSLNMGLENNAYNGVIALGCSINERTLYHDMAITECARAIQDLSIYYSIPLGFGLLIVNNIQQALDKAEEYAKNAANTCIQMMKVKEQFISNNDRKTPRFN